MRSPWGDGQGLPGLWPGSSHFLWTGVLTLAPPTTHPHGNPHAHAPAPCVSQKPPLSCSAKNLGLAGSCGGPLECRFPVPAPVCQPWQSLWGRMGDHRISSGTGAAGGHEPRREGRADLPASSQVGDILYSGRPEPLTGSPLTIPPGVGGAGLLATRPPITLFPPAAHTHSASRFTLEPCWGRGEVMLCVGDSC